MIKVIIVDDEYLERVLIARSFDWEANGFTILGDASNGAEALELCLKDWPDLVLTDINMPFMDGLELGTRLKELNAETEIIIISGFDEFSYAKRGIDIGIRSYLLKPLDRSELADVLLKAKKNIEAARSDLGARGSLFIHGYFQRLIDGVSDGENLKESDSFSRLLTENVVCVSIAARAQSVALSAVATVIDKELSCAHYTFEHASGTLVLLALITRKERVFIDELKAFFRGLSRRFDSCLSIAISDPVAGAEEIAPAYQQTCMLLATLETLGLHEPAETAELPALSARIGSGFEPLAHDFSFALRNGRRDRAAEILDAFFSRLKAPAGPAMLDVCLALSAALEGQGFHLSDILEGDNVHSLVLGADSPEAAYRVAAELTRRTADHVSDHIDPAASNSIGKIIKYIDEHFTDPTLSLKTIAKEFFFNESYLSRTFKLNMKESFVEYLVKKRMEYSLELFKATDMKIYQIAEAVGINDPNYFGKCFKKYAGITAIQYRAQSRTTRSIK